MNSELDLHLNTGAMALDALPDDEALAFADHLETCETCTIELAGFRETIARVAASTALVPSADLRTRILAAAAATPQLRPVTVPRHAAVAHDPAADDTPTGPLATVIPIRSWYRRPTSWLAAAAAAAVIAVGSVVTFGGTGTTSQPVAACVESAQVRTTATPIIGSGGDVVSAPSCSAVTVSLPSLPAPGAGKTYQMWIIKGTGAQSQRRSLEVLSPNPVNGHMLTALVAAGDTAIALTVEPTGGSAQPTTDPIWVVPITTA